MKIYCNKKNKAITINSIILLSEITPQATTQLARAVAIILDMLIALIGIGLGVACIIYREAEAINVIYIILGTAITVLGIFDIILAVEEIKKRKEEGPAKPEIIEAEGVDISSQNTIVEVKTKTRRRKKVKELPLNDEKLDQSEE